MTITGRELIRLLENRGFVILRQKGSHVRLKGPNSQYLTTLIHGTRSLPTGTLAILREAGLTTKDLQS